MKHGTMSLRDRAAAWAFALFSAAALLADLPADDWDARFAPDEILTEKGILQ